MTTKQRLYLMSKLWPDAAEAQGWRRDDRERRLEEASRAIGRPIHSFNDLDNSADVDKLFAHFGALAYNIKRAVELTPAGADYGNRRRLLWLIRKEARAVAPAAPEDYIARIAADKFRITPGLTTIEDLDTHQLNQLMITLHARASARARANKNASLTSEETFPDQVEFQPEPETANCPF